MAVLGDHSAKERARKKKRMKTMLLLRTEVWAEESSLVHLGIKRVEDDAAKDFVLCGDDHSVGCCLSK